MASDLYKFIGARIAEFRKAAGLSQAELADRLEEATNTVSRWETATYKPTADDLVELSRLFSVPISWFFPPELRPHQEVEQQTRALLSALGDLHPDDIEELARYAEFRRARRLLESAKRPKARKGQATNGPG